MKTAKQWFETFPEPYRSEAIDLIPSHEKMKYPSRHLALDHTIDFQMSPQGSRYWERFYFDLLNGKI